MYLWKVDALVEDLRDDRVTQREQFKYYLTVILLWTVGAHMSWLAATVAQAAGVNMSYGVFDAIGVALSLGVTVLGIFVCHKMNGIGDGTGFITRMICLSVPVLIRTAVFVGLPTNVLWAITQAIFSSDSPALDASDAQDARVVLLIVTPTLLHGVALYAYLATKIRKVAAL